MYKVLIRPILFLVDPERIHYFVFDCLRLASAIPGVRSLLKLFYTYEDTRLQKTMLGLTFRNPVGLAAGFDKNALCVDDLDALGFGFIEVGTLTPKAQSGNDKPRLFRLPADHALINRMGFNNDGVDVVAKRLKSRKSKLIIGGNIGKNKLTPNEDAASDYVYCFEALYPVVDYFVLNVSSPNTPGLRALQEKGPLRDLLSRVKGLSKSKSLYKPIFLKIAPDLTNEQLSDVVEVLRQTGTDGVIATNTTISRDQLNTPPEEIARIGAGGLSGEPLAENSTRVIRYLREQLGPAFPIIGVGGIMTPQDALDKLEAGADLVQVYTGFVYEGPAFVKRINQMLAVGNVSRKSR